MAGQTLEQKRAAHAWEKTEGCSEEYSKLAKGLPILIMGSGLMQVLAFLNEKGKKSQSHQTLGSHLRGWLSSRYPQQITSDEFSKVMEALLKAEPAFYQQVTAEALAWLRWLRQIAPARNLGKP